MTGLMKRTVKAVEEQLIGHVDPYSDAMSEYGIAQMVVKTVLAAIREPGNDIYQAGFDAEVAANPHKTQPHHVVPAVWQAMIDAMLKES